MNRYKTWKESRNRKEKSLICIPVFWTKFDVCERNRKKRVLSMCTKSTEKGGPQPGHQGIGRKVTWLGEGEWRGWVPLMAFEKRKNNGIESNSQSRLRPARSYRKDPC